MKKIGIATALIACTKFSLAHADIVTNSAGDKIWLDPDGTWKQLAGNNATLFRGDKAPLFEMRFWIDTASVVHGYEKNDFSGEKRFSYFWSGCLGGLVLDYKGSQDFKFTTMVHEIAIVNTDPTYSFTLAYSWPKDVIIKPGSTVSAFFLGAGKREKTESLADANGVQQRIMEVCDWRRFRSIMPSFAEKVVFEDGSELSENQFWEHVTFEILPKDAKLEVTEKVR